MIQNITIENFLNFRKFEASRLAGINLLIGDNDTGKTGLLKLLYAVSKTWEIYSRRHAHGSPSFKKILGEKIFDTFQPRGKNQIGELVTKGAKEKLKVEVTYQAGEIHQNISFQFGETTKNTLIRNRQLNAGAVLFLDEPETALHPKAIRQLSKIMVRLAALGVQVFLSTHNYFVIKQLYICARKEKTSISCFSLLNKQDSIDVHFTDLRDGMPRNPIVDEALDMFDEDIALDLGL